MIERLCARGIEYLRYGGQAAPQHIPFLRYTQSVLIIWFTGPMLMKLVNSSSFSVPIRYSFSSALQRKVGLGLQLPHLKLHTVEASNKGPRSVQSHNDGRGIHIAQPCWGNVFI